MKAGNETNFLEALKSELGDKVLKAHVLGPRRIVISVKPGDHKAAIGALKKFGGSHMSTITGTDMGGSIEIAYHIWCYQAGAEVTIKTEVPKASPEIETVSDIIPGSLLYEAEARDLLGIEFKGLPYEGKLILPEDWPEGVHPLRKDWKPDWLK
ncbi:MAG: NADH-quinone oxidoreductase subunit C [Candidatus Bathyarchaeia archaeon]